jgi:hypothetical protein
MASLIALTLMVMLSLMAVSTTQSYAFDINHERIGRSSSSSSSSSSRYNSCIPQLQRTTPTSCPATTTTLYSVASFNDEQDDDDDKEEAVIVESKRSRLRRTIFFWNNDNNNRMTTQSRSSNQTTRRRSKKRAAKIVAASLASAGGIVSILGGGVGAPIIPASYALTQADIAEQGLQIYSLRPGISIEQAEQLGKGEMPDEVRDNIDAKSSVGKTTGLSKEDAIIKTKKSDLYGEYDADNDEDDDDDDDDFDEADEEYLFGTEKSDSGTAIDVRKQRASSFGSSTSSGSTASTDVSNKISKGTKDSFSGGSKTKPIMVYASVGVACFIPTFGLFGVRDFIRNRKEEKNVKKGLEIIEAQRAEYFGIDKNGKNITDTNSTDTTSDGDIDDELKDLKDGDDDDDDDDDDDEPEPPKRKRRSLPKTPPGDGSGGSGSGSGGDSSGSGSSGGYDNDNGGEDGPSDDDIQRLGDIFNKS